MGSNRIQRTFIDQGIVMSGPEEIVNLFSDILDQRASLESKYPIGSKVMIKPTESIVDHLVPVYTPIEAKRIARWLRNQWLTLEAVDEMTDDEGSPGIYYTVSDMDGLNYVFPERIFCSEFRN